MFGMRIIAYFCRVNVIIYLKRYKEHRTYVSKKTGMWVVRDYTYRRRSTPSLPQRGRCRACEADEERGRMLKQGYT